MKIGEWNSYLIKLIRVTKMPMEETFTFIKETMNKWRLPLTLTMKIEQLLMIFLYKKA